MVLITRNILLHSVVVEGRKNKKEKGRVGGILYVLAGDIAYEGSAVREMEG